MDETNETIFVGGMEFLREEIPERKTSKVVSPRSAILGVSDEILDDVLFTRVKMQDSDFISPPKKLPRLLFMKRESLEKNPEAAARVSPLTLAVSTKNKSGFITGCNEDAERKLSAIMRDSYLLLPLYPSPWRGLMPFGVDIVFRRMWRSAASGKLLAMAFACNGLFMFGERYTMNNAAYRLEYFWNQYSHSRIMEALEKNLCEFDIKNTTEAIC